MDRSMKVMFGMMTVAICLLAITMMGNQSQQAYAGEYVGGGDRGTDPTIVSFRVTPIHRENRWHNGSSYHDGLFKQSNEFNSLDENVVRRSCGDEHCWK